MLGGSVPWSAETVAGQRLVFCELAVSDDDGEQVSFVELCRRFGIAPKTGYKWLERYRLEGPDGLLDRSRRPLRSPTRTSAAMEELVCELRRQHRMWGGRKIARRLKDLGHSGVPAPSTISDILRRNDLLGVVEAHHGGYTSFEAEHPNDLWQMDFKGWFDTGTGVCHPFDVLDDHSRYSLCLDAARDQTDATVRTRLRAIFEQFGLPLRILCDNGPPWGAANATVRDTALGVWLIDLGVAVSHARIRHPQTLGKDERFHRTVELEVISARPFWESHDQLQAAFDRWRPVYNHQRPHDAHDGATPATRYQPSSRSMPTRIEPVDYPDGYQVRKVTSAARITYQGTRYRIGKPYIGRHVGLVPTATDGVLDVVYRHHHIKTIDLRQ